MIAYYVRRNQYEAIQMDGEWIILNTDDYTVTQLNEIGGFCWSLLHQTQTLQSLIQAVHDKYEMVSEDVERDIEVFLSDLIKCGLLKHAS
ncbi:MAG: PqqD family protein [Paenibacillaceae bacterium]